MIQDNIFDELTIIIVSYFSDEQINLLLKTLDKNIKIIIIENSQNYEFKKEVENIYKNIDVIIPTENLGNGGGINLGLKNVQTKYVLNLDPDVKISNKAISNLVSKAQIIQNFSVLAPKIIGQNYEKLIIGYNNNLNLKKISYSTGCAILLNYSVIKKIGFFDENYFLYYEELDLYKRCLDNNEEIYLIEDSEAEHLGTQSINKAYELESKICRNWHYCWSKFYYYRKHYNYFYAIKKTLPNFLRALKNYMLSIFKNDISLIKIHKAEIKGLFAAYFLKKSYYRIKL